MPCPRFEFISLYLFPMTETITPETFISEDSDIKAIIPGLLRSHKYNVSPSHFPLDFVGMHVFIRTFTNNYYIFLLKNFFFICMT